MAELDINVIIWPPHLVEDDQLELPRLTGEDWNRLVKRVEYLEKDERASHTVFFTSIHTLAERIEALEKSLPTFWPKFVFSVSIGAIVGVLAIILTVINPFNLIR